MKMLKVRRALRDVGVAALLGVATGLWVHAAAPQAATSSVQPANRLLEQIHQRVQNAPVVRGSFEQHKTVQGFKQPLRSSGDFVVAQGQGIAWQVRQPFASTLIVKPDSLQSRQSDGSISMQMQASDEPVLRTVNAMLFAVMAADLKQLAQYFDVSGQVHANGWTLHLVPRDALLAQWLKVVELQGGRFVQQVVLEEARGDRSVIRIQDAAAAQTLRAQETELFR